MAENSPKLVSIRDQITQFPNRSGVYLMKNADETIIYVGKARNLKKRVTSYFSGSKDLKTRVLVRNIVAIEYITTRNEFEALLLENTLIKKWNPRYNINLKDGKSYPVIRITNEAYPRVFRTRRIIEDGSEYYGPYPNVSTIDVYLELIEKLYPLRKCRGALKKRDHPCLYYHIHRCVAPCAQKATRDEYMQNVDGIRRMLTESIDELIPELREKMTAAGEALEFEKAAEYRDAISAVEQASHQQDVVDFDSELRDYVAVVEREAMCSFAVLQMRTGRLVGREVYHAENYADIDEALQQFLLQYYGDIEILPDALYLAEEGARALIQRYFTEKRESNTVVLSPDETRHVSVLKLARENALEDIIRRQQGDRIAAGLEELRLALSLPKAPKRIEGFDISHLAGKHTVASMVSFADGKPDKKEYRTFHVKSLDGKIDDFASMKEIVARRYTRVLNEKLDRPDLVLIDGGKGQVSSAVSILKALGLEDMPIVGLAKREEEIFLPGENEPVRLPEGSAALRILQHVRDESHRFATSFNKRLRQKDIKLSILEEVAGIGPKRAKQITMEFGTLEAVFSAGVEELSKKVGLPEKTAREAWDTIRRTLEPTIDADSDLDQGAVVAERPL